MTTDEDSTPDKAIGARLGLGALAVALAALDLGLKTWALHSLAAGQAVDLAVIQLRLAFNPGVAFSLGGTVPPAVLLALSGVIIAGLAVVAWRWSPRATVPVRLALAMLLGGALANFVDRAHDGLVTDYLHTGWFPTFNGADVFITLGASVLVLASLRAERQTVSGPAGRGD